MIFFYDFFRIDDEMGHDGRGEGTGVHYGDGMSGNGGGSGWGAGDGYKSHGNMGDGRGDGGAE